VPNGNPSFDLAEQEAWFAPLAQTIGELGRKHNLLLEKYYHESFSWDLRFNHPRGGHASVTVWNGGPRRSGRPGTSTITIDLLARFTGDLRATWQRSLRLCVANSSWNSQVSSRCLWGSGTKWQRVTSRYGVSSRGRPFTRWLESIRIRFLDSRGSYPSFERTVTDIVDSSASAGEIVRSPRWMAGYAAVQLSR
jgi:hypothetical protein